MKKKTFGALVAAVSAAALLSGAASAEEAKSAPASASGDELPAYGDEEWRYNTYYLFPLTRHMGDAELQKFGRYALYPLAAVLDVVQLPVGALGGLLGE